MNQAVLVAMAVFVYLFPTLFALSRGSRSTGAILVVNVLLGWTGLGWIGSLVWAAVNDERRG